MREAKQPATENRIDNREDSRKHNTWLRIALVIFVLVAVFWTPWIMNRLTTNGKIVDSLTELPPSDAVLVFGGYIPNPPELPPLTLERVEAGRHIYAAGLTKSIVVSNVSAATNAMGDYLVENGIPEAVVDRHEGAYVTPDTCTRERLAYGTDRKVVFISQRYHLARILWHCKREGISGIGFAPEQLGIIDRSETPLIQKITLRTSRTVREATLLWLMVVGIY